MMKRYFAVAFLLACAFVANAFASPDSLMVEVRGATGTPSFQSPTGIWWPKSLENATAKGKKPRAVKHAARAARESARQSSVVVWFHGGMGSSNCAKGLEAGASFADFYSGKIVVSVSACRENHWVTKGIIDVVDVALDSVAARRKSPVVLPRLVKRPYKIRTFVQVVRHSVLILVQRASFIVNENVFRRVGALVQVVGDTVFVFVGCAFVAILFKCSTGLGA